MKAFFQVVFFLTELFFPLFSTLIHLFSFDYTHPPSYICSQSHFLICVAHFYFSARLYQYLYVQANEPTIMIISSALKEILRYCIRSALQLVV